MIAPMLGLFTLLSYKSDVRLFYINITLIFSYFGETHVKI